jgi:hypothetical protein
VHCIARRLSLNKLNTANACFNLLRESPIPDLVFATLPEELSVFSERKTPLQ